ncbi:esterase [Rhodococcus sp. 05-340-1]|uniref:alpha/beta hydrolase n=1 Tax=unclassified Rhodococcus (in: high G+C Gram-positive bacteria) TaxID=192944 RepID=UPI000B9BB28D|nr:MULTISPECIES: alpha/beta hydrolase-fold protein [unclassified Rhodococcus (in: high G+C Gram-positive bacteria)]OZD67136.1 esterase [Rhodococcus sp. 05-340-2]OZD81216.1 esterase [Rhodococcus sp. 05-340-1]
MDWFDSLSLIDGPLPVIVVVAGVLGGVWLLVSRSRRYMTRGLPIAATAAVVVTVIGYLIVEKVWRPLPDPIETSIYVWIGVGLASLFAVTPRSVAAHGVVGTFASVVAAVLVVAVSALNINLKFEAYPTVGTALGVESASRIQFSDVPAAVSRTVTGTPLDSVWTSPAGMPSAGRITSAAIPATASNFSARDAQIYLPPAYFSDPRPLLPVLVLLAGQPGDPEDWLNGGKLAETMDDFARDHAGLAPVVVVADGTGSPIDNPLCVDSPLGNVDTYLSRDVPDWIDSSLQVDPDRRHWAIGGLSYGGTCSIQMATNHPDVYPTFLDLSGQTEPSLGDRDRTVREAFGGNPAAFAAVNPLDLLKSRQYPDSAGIFVVGSDDNDYKPGQQEMYNAAKAAGMDVQYVEVPGGHSFAVWSEGLRRELPWLATRTGLIS